MCKSDLIGKPDDIVVSPLEPSGSRSRGGTAPAGGTELYAHRQHPKLLATYKCPTSMPNSSVNQAVSQNIAELRCVARRTRSNMRQATIQRNVRLLARYFFDSPIYQKSRRIAFYYPIKNEAGSIDVLTQSLRDGKECYLPVIHRISNSMKFIRTGATTALKTNQHGIPEPISLCSIQARQLDIILLPLLGFDRFGSRIGMGGGYYDRALEFTRHDQYYRRPRLIGLAHNNQKQSTIASREWDIPLDGVFTESGLKLFTHYN